MTREEKAIAVENVRQQILGMIKDRVTWWKSSAKVTVTLETSYKINQQILPEITMKRSDGNLYIPVILFIVFALGVCIATKSFMGILYSPVIIVLWVVNSKYQKSIVYHIVIDHRGITLGDELIKWGDIFQTYIADQPYGKTMKRLLFVVLNDTKYREFNISNPSYSDLGHIIGHYRRLYIDSAESKAN